jgi:hypothetical protein
MKSLGHPIEHFQVPPLAPEPVAKAAERFNQISAELQEAHANYGRLSQSIHEDVAAANKAAAKARVEGKKPPALTGDKVKQRLVDVQAERDALLDAIDVAGDQLAALVDKHRPEWLANLEVGEKDAEQRFSQAISDAREAASDLQEARSAPNWLRSFSLSACGFGNQTQYPGGRVITIDPGDRARFMDSNTPIEMVLEMAALVVNPDQDPEPIAMADGERFATVVAGVKELP